MSRGLFARKPIADASAETSGDAALQRVLGAGDLIMLAIGAVIGAGIFGAIGTAAAGQVGPDGAVVRYGAGPALVLSFLILGAACALAALCYAELASMIPQAGSAYAYTYATLGELVAWAIGWDLILEYAVAAGAVAVGWSGYINGFLHSIGWGLPVSLTAGPGDTVTLPDGTIAKAKEVSGADNLLFRRNSQTGAVEVTMREGTWGGLNAALHATD